MNNVCGSFSVCVYNKTTGKITITRDAVCKKPLFYLGSERIFAFSSDIRSLCVLRDKKPKPNTDYLATYLLRGEHTSGNTKYRNIRRVKPGEAIEVDVGDGGMDRTIWRSLETRGKLSEEEAYKKFRERYKSVAREHVAHGSTPAIQVSGGVDSTTMASVIGSSPIDTSPFFYSVTYRRERPAESAMLGDVEDFADINISRYAYDTLEVPTIGNTKNIFNDRLHNPFHFIHKPIFDRHGYKNEVDLLMTGIGADMVMGAPFYKYKYLHYLENFNIERIIKEAFTSFNQRWFLNFLVSLISYGIVPLSNLDKLFPKAGGDYSTPFYVTADFETKGLTSSKRTFSENIVKDLIISSIYNDTPHTEETMDKIFASMGISTVSFYHDRRLLDIVLRSKVSTLFKSGKAKNLVKESLSEDIPSHIYRRRTKSGYDEILANEIRKEKEYIEELIHYSQFDLPLIEWSYIHNFFYHIESNNVIEESRYSDLRDMWSLVSVLDWYEKNF